MIQKEEYKQARETVNEYEMQLKLSVVSGITCWIMHRTDDDLIFVTTDKQYAERLYEGGGYIMRESEILDPM